MATSPAVSVPRPGGASPTLAEVNDRLAVALDRASAFEAQVDPRLLLELREVIDEALQLAGVRSGCRHACADQGLHCPAAEPPERMLADLQRRGWVSEWDPVEARIALDTVCLCGSHMYYVALRPGDGDLANAYAICPGCRHWRQL